MISPTPACGRPGNGRSGHISGNQGKASIPGYGKRCLVSDVRTLNRPLRSVRPPGRECSLCFPLRRKPPPSSKQRRLMVEVVLFKTTPKIIFSPKESRGQEQKEAIFFITCHFLSPVPLQQTVFPWIGRQKRTPNVPHCSPVSSISGLPGKDQSPQGIKKRRRPNMDSALLIREFQL